MSRQRRKTSRQRASQRTYQQRPANVTRQQPAPVAEKSNPALASITMFNDVPQPHTMPRNYKNYADEGYATNDSVYKCVSYIITNGAAIPPKLFTDANRETEIKSHPLLDKLAHPNPEQDGVTFREAILGWYLIAGNAFLYAIRPGKPNASTGRITGAPDELWTLDPVKVHPLPHPLRGVIGYKFDDFSNDQNPIPAANIGHLRTWNPKDPIFGLSPVEVAALMVDQQNAARKWNLALMQNMGKTSGAWVTDAVLGKNERDQLEAKINEKLAGARNAGKIPVIDAGAKFVSNSVPPSELDWLKSMQYNAGQIANIFNIAPQLIGDTSATTYNNMEQAKAASYTEAIFPALDKLYSLLTMWLVPMYPDLADAKGNPTASLYYDKDSVEVIQNVVQAQKMAQAERAVTAYQAGAITLNQAQAMQDLPDLGAKGDIYRIGDVLVPADKLVEYAEQSLTEPAKPPKPVPEPLGDEAVPPHEPMGDPQQSAPTPAAPSEPPPTSTTPTNDGEKAWLLAAARQKKRQLRRHQTKAAPGAFTHLVWQCDGAPCEFCLQNDGAIVEADDDGEPVTPFPNGCTSPDDSHRFCECQVYQLDVPAEAHSGLPDAIPEHTADGAESAHGQQALAALIGAFAVGVLAARHNRDVAEAAAQTDSDTDTLDSGGNLYGGVEGEDHTGATYATSEPPATPKKPKKPPSATAIAAGVGAGIAATQNGQSDRKKSREDYREFMEVTVG